MFVTRLGYYVASVDKAAQICDLPASVLNHHHDIQFPGVAAQRSDHEETASSDCLRLLNISECPELNDMHLPSVRADVVEELLVEVEGLVGQLEIVMGLDMYGLCNLAAIRRLIMDSASLFTRPSSRGARYVPRT